MKKDLAQPSTADSPIHQRMLDLKTYAVDDETVLVVGTLKDDRFRPIYELSGKKREPGGIHHMIIRLRVGGLPLRIIDAEAEMPHVPNELCRTTQESIRKVIGLEIKSGFGERVHRLMGGVKGCAHLTHLLVVMAQEAVHGYWTHQMQKSRPVPQSIEEIEGLSLFINSCSLWRQNGPIIQEIKAAIEGRKRSS